MADGPIIDYSQKVRSNAIEGNRPSDIMKAREEVENQNSILNARAGELLSGQKGTRQEIENFGNAIRDLTDKIKEYDKKVRELSKSTEQADIEKTKELKLQSDLAKQFLSSIDAQRQHKKFLRESADALQALTKFQKEGKGAFEDIAESVDDLDELIDILPVLTKGTKEFSKNMGKLSDVTARATTAKVQERNAEIKAERERKRNTRSEEQRTGNTAGQDLNKAVKAEIGKLGDSLSQLLNTWNINKLASQLAPSSKQILQGNLQTTYNLSAGEFDDFKRELYDQMEGTKYSNEDILKAMEALNTTELGSTKTATAYFKDLVRGQKLLGMSAQTQQELLKLGNQTGRNELVFYQNQVAKYLNSSLGLNKQQLDELVNLNANMQGQAYDLGIATEAFKTMSMNEGAAFEATGGKGYAAKYTQAISSLFTNTDTAAALLGMDSGELAERLARGESFIDLLRNGQGAREILNVLASGDQAQISRMREHASSALGVDADMWSVLNIIATQSRELNKNLATANTASATSGEEAMESLEEKQFESINSIQSKVEDIVKWLNKNFEWQILQTLTSIGVMIATLISTTKILGNIGEILSAVKGVKDSSVGGSLLSKLTGSKIGGKLLTTVGGKAAYTTLGTGLIGGGLLAGGLITGGVDAFKTANYSDNKLLGGARGFFMGTGHSGQTNDEKAGSIVGNGLKGAAIGAGIGTFIGGPAGTGIGALIGGGLGLILGGIGTMLDKKGEKELTEAEKRAKREEEYFEAIKQNTYNTAMNTAKSGIGVVYRYRGHSNYSMSAGGPAMGGPAGGNYSVTSNYGARKSFKTDNGAWTSSFHSGTDFGAPEGTPLYSNVTGTVLAAGKDGAGANYVGVTDDKTGYTHWYWHMMKPASVQAGQRVQKGELVGYVGHTGNAKGDHLHYTVTKPGRKDWWNAQESTVDPLPFATSSIFEGGAYTSTTGTDSVIPTVGIAAAKAVKLKSSNIGDSSSVVDSIKDLKQTIINLSEQTSRNQKIMDALVNRTMESPTI